MLAACSLKPPAPSRNLLRFLRFQSDSFFFTSNPSSIQADTTNIPTLLQWNHERSGKKPWIRLNPAPCLAQIEASLFPVWPSSKTSTSRKSAQLRTSTSLLSDGRSSECLGTLRYVASRSASTKTRRWWQNWMFRKESYLKWKNSTSPPITSFPDEGAEGSLFNLGRTLVSKSLDEPRLRCTEFDENGNVTLVNGEFRKSELIAKVSVPVVGTFNRS